MHLCRLTMSCVDFCFFKIHFRFILTANDQITPASCAEQERQALGPAASPQSDGACSLWDSTHSLSEVFQQVQDSLKGLLWISCSKSVPAFPGVRSFWTQTGVYFIDSLEADVSGAKGELLQRYRTLSSVTYFAWICASCRGNSFCRSAWEQTHR